MLRCAIVLLSAVGAAAGCATRAPEQVTISFTQSRYGAPIPCVNGECRPLPEEQERAIIQEIVNTYCPAD